MKKLALLFSIAFCYCSVQAQTMSNRNGLAFRLLNHDYAGPITHSYFDNNRTTYGAEVGYYYSLNKSFNIGLPLRISSVDFPLNDAATNFKHNTACVSVDADLIYKFNNDYIIPENFWLAPYALTGVAGKYLDKTNGKLDFEMPFGVGVSVRLVPDFYLQAQAEYRLSFVEQKNNLVASFGFLYTFATRLKDKDHDGIADDVDQCPLEPGTVAMHGCPDKDGDGIKDGDDACPTEAGTVAMKGCPDRDGDGIADKDDVCPDQKGLAKFNGCPDTDGDGIADKEDLCPTVPGLIAFHGCPDTDGDGIEDSKDKCPTEKGLPNNMGCPIKDTDKDGVPDDEDLCPTVPGPVATKGCPEIKKEDQQILDKAMHNVTFETGKAILTKASDATLNEVVEVLKTYPHYKCNIDGYTDNVGDVKSNELLSENRAKACYDYLISKGIPASRLKFAGHGETSPLGPNTTEQGRALNRRVEFNLVLTK